MADHGAGPRATANPEIDITDLFAFPSPERPGHLVLIMNAYPFKHIEATRLLFSDAIDYRIRVRPVRIATRGVGAAFAVGDDECFFSFTFVVQSKVTASDTDGTCPSHGRYRRPRRR
jgi:hypothetical protein